MLSIRTWENKLEFAWENPISQVRFPELTMETSVCIGHHKAAWCPSLRLALSMVKTASRGREIELADKNCEPGKFTHISDSFSKQTEVI